MNSAVFGKTMGNEKTETLNLSQQKEEELFSIRTKFSYYKVFHRKVMGNINEKKQSI